MRIAIGSLLCGCIISCTSPNPEYVAPPDQGGIVFLDGGAEPGDLAGAHDHHDGGAHDLAGGAPGASDLSTAPMCSGSARTCVVTRSGSVIAQSCSGNTPITRECPFGTTGGDGASCEGGWCRPPTSNGTTSCDTGGPLESVCSAPPNGPPEFSCQPFVIDPAHGNAEWWCAVAANAGAGGAGASCKQGSDCHTGFCASNGRCFWACQTDGDCPVFGMHCNPVSIDVEGVSVNAS